MTAGLRTDLPTTNDGLRQAIYDGAIFLVQQPSSLKCLIADVVARVEAEFGDDYRQIHRLLTNDEIMERIGRVKKKVYRDPELQRTVSGIIQDIGFEPQQQLLDPPRLRAVLSGGHENAKAAAAYAIHRDTWYGNPQAQINWWLPLHDVSENESFRFFPDCFNRPVENDSAVFDYAEWAAKIGFGNSYGGKANLYPSTTEVDEQGALHFSCQGGDLILFSAAQLHVTNNNMSGLTRFSLDFRTVDLGDHSAGRGAPNVDNYSTGSAAGDYLPIPHPGIGTEYSMGGKPSN